MFCKRKIFSAIIEYTVALCAFAGVILSNLNSLNDGYFPWATRLMYFTQQSNIWIGVTCLFLAVLHTIELKKRKKIVKRWVYIVRYAFVVSILLTGIIFCALLAPFTDFNPWSLYSLLTHVVVPVLAFVDFCVDKDDVVLQKKEVWYGLVPSLFYLVFAGTLSLCKVDFGRGEPYPYPFFDYYSSVGLFGVETGNPPRIGAGIWTVALLLFIYGLCLICFAVHKKTRGYKNKKQ